MRYQYIGWTHKPYSESRDKYFYERFEPFYTNALTDVEAILYEMEVFNLTKDRDEAEKEFMVFDNGVPTPHWLGYTRTQARLKAVKERDR